MSGMMDTLISGIVKSAMTEILKKTGVKAPSTKRTKRRTRSATTSTTKTSSRSRKPTSRSSRGAPAAGSARAPAKKQVSKRRTNTARSKAKRRG